MLSAFKYSLISEKWDAVGQMYSMLASQAYGKMTEQELSSEDEDTIQKGRELLIDFARYCIVRVPIPLRKMYFSPRHAIPCRNIS